MANELNKGRVSHVDRGERGVERTAAFTHRPITLNMLNDRGNSLLYPILAKAASALTSIEFRMMIAGAMKMALVAGFPGLAMDINQSSGTTA